MYQCHEAIVTPVDSVTRTGLRVQAVDKQPSSRTFYLRGDRRLTLPETLASSSDKVTNVVGQTILIVVAVIVSVHIFRVECEISIVGLGLASRLPRESQSVSCVLKIFFENLGGILASSVLFFYHIHHVFLTMDHSISIFSRDEFDVQDKLQDIHLLRMKQKILEIYFYCKIATCRPCSVKNYKRILSLVIINVMSRRGGEKKKRKSV